MMNQFENVQKNKSDHLAAVCVFAKMWRNNTQGKSQPAVTRGKKGHHCIEAAFCTKAPKEC